MNRTTAFMKFTTKSKIFLLLMFFFFSLLGNAQSKITIKGKLIDKETSRPIEEATVYITAVKDSTIIDYTVTNKSGTFKFETKKITTPFFLKTDALGYKAHKIKENTLAESKDFGVFSLLKEEIVLSEVVIKSEVPPVRIKKDTLEFNAKSFKVRPDANVEALIRQLPGASIDENKRITINGKVVDKILVNGKPFFSEDGKIALQNLSADMIKKVQVSNTKTKEQEMTKQGSTSNTATINLTLSEDKNKGVFGKFMGGYGTDDRYETSGIGSYFKDKRRITAIASSNNIDATGFSMDDVFDNMEGGRNNGGMRFGGNGNAGPTGITRSTTLGVNYNDEWVKNLKSHIAYNYRNLNNNNSNRTSRSDFLPTGNIFTSSESKSNQESESHIVTTEFEYKINDKTGFIMSPNFAKSNSTSNASYEGTARDDNNNILNQNSNRTSSLTDSGNFNSSMALYREFKRQGRYLVVSMENDNSKSDGNSMNNSQTLFFQDTTPDDIRNQNILSRRTDDNLGLNGRFMEPISDSTSVSIGVRTNITKTKDETNTFDFDTSTDRYSDKNELLSNYFDSKSSRFSPSVEYMIRKKNLWMYMSVGTYFVQADYHSNYLNTNTNLTKNFGLPEGNMNLNYTFMKTKSIYGAYSRSYTLPTAAQILPVENLANPLNTVIGNSDLGIGKNHDAYIRYESQNTANHTSLSIYSNLNYRDQDIASSTLYDENGKQRTTYVNISGNYNVTLGGNWDKTVKKEANVYKYSFRLNSGFDYQKGFTNAELYTAAIKSLSPTVSFSYDYGAFFTLRPSYTFSYRKTDYTNYSIDETSNREHNFVLEATNYIYKQWVFGNDFSYNYNSNISGGFKKDFYLWNTSLSYKTKDDTWIFRCKVYDILDQNQSAIRTITATSIVDAQNTVLKRYAMFSVTFKFKKFGTKLEAVEVK